MKQLVLLSEDVKGCTQIELWLKELGQDLGVLRIHNKDEFFNKYCLKANETKVEAATLPPQEAATLPANSSPPAKADAVPGLAIDYLIVDHEAIGEKFLAWLADVNKSLFANGKSSLENPLKTVVLAFEGSHFEIEKFRSELITDLIMQPIDRTLFLQKMEYVLGKKGSVSPSFLFKQAAKQIIEIGKDTTIKRLNDWSFAIRNPVPLAYGLFAKVYSPVFGVNAENGVIGRVYKSTEHPTEANYFLVYFSFFGISHNQLMNVRRYLHEKEKKKKAKKKTAAPKTQAPGSSLNIAIIHADRNVSDEVRSILEANFQGVKCHLYPAYTSLLRTLIPAATKKAEPASGVAPESAFPEGKPLRVTIGDAFELLSFETPLKETDQVFSVAVSQHLAKPTEWLALIEAEFKEDFTEFLTQLKGGEKSAILVCFKGLAQQRFHIKIDAPNANLQPLMLEMSEMTAADFAKARTLQQRNAQLSSLDAIYIAASFLRDDPPAWYQGFSEVLRTAGLLQAGRDLPVFVLGSDSPAVSPLVFRFKQVTDYLSQPLDRKLVSYKAIRFIEGLNFKKTDDIELSFHEVDILACATKEVHMEEISEFGLQIKHVVPLRENLYIRFFSPMFVDDTGQGVLGRCYFCLKDQKDPSIYHCFFMFFGVTDSFLKHIRKWIREEYVNKKEQSE